MVTRTAQRIAFALFAAAIVTAIAAGSALVPARQLSAAVQPHVVNGRVVDAMSGASLDPCPDVTELVTGAKSETGQSVDLGCLARAAARGLQADRAGDPCDGVHIHDGASIRVLDGHDRLLARAVVGPGHVSADDTGHCVFTFALRVPSRPAYRFVASPDQWVTETRAELESAHWQVGMQV